MKHTLPIILSGFVALTLATTSCKRDNGLACDISESINKDSTSIVGTWELRSAGNGWTGTQSYADCNGNRLVFKADGTYRQYEAWALTRQGTYQIFPDSFRLRRSIGNRIVYDNNVQPVKIFVINRGTYIGMETDAYDAGGSTYVRRNDVVH